MPAYAAKATLAALSIFALGTLAGCSSDSEESAIDETMVAETTASETGGGTATEDAPEETGGTDVTRYVVGDTFTAGDEFFGMFDITYLGVADMGRLDDGFDDEVECYAVLVEATLLEMPADNPDPALGGVTHEVLDANGDKAADNFSSGCSDTILEDNGYPTKYGVDWVPGTPVMVTMEKLTVPVADTDKADSVDIDPLGGYVLDFDVVATW